MNTAILIVTGAALLAIIWRTRGGREHRATLGEMIADHHDRLDKIEEGVRRQRQLDELRGIYAADSFDRHADQALEQAEPGPDLRSI